MSYSVMRQQLLNEFNKSNILQVWNAGQINTLHYQIPNNYNLNLTINYPGKKTKVVNNTIKAYDYRVDLNGIAISHANIITDLYNKALQLIQMGSDTRILEDLLIDIAYNGISYRRTEHLAIDRFEFTAPSIQLLNQISTIHTNIQKTFQIDGNVNWSYSLDELANSISWIVLQEDINYPMPRYQGRKMPFYRYLEALYCAANPQNPYNYTLSDVIVRALVHNGPPPALWTGCNINYSPIKSIK